MKNRNYKVDWLIQNKVAALTHFHSKISQDDITGVFNETNHLLKNVKEAFHIIIDNRLATISQIYSLSQLQYSSSILSHPLLEYLIIVKPSHLNLSEEHRKMETENGVKLKNVNSIRESIDFLIQTTTNISLHDVNFNFFPNLKLHDLQ